MNKVLIALTTSFPAFVLPTLVIANECWNGAAVGGASGARCRTVGARCTDRSTALATQIYSRPCVARLSALPERERAQSSSDLT